MLFFLLVIQAGINIEPVDPHDEANSLGKYLAILEDPTSKLELAELISGSQDAHFRRGEQAVPNMGFSTSTWWFRLTVLNKGEADLQRWLLLRNNSLKHVDLYVFDGLPNPGDKPILSKHSGDLTPMRLRDLPSSNFGFELFFPAGEKRTLFLRVRGDKSIGFPLHLYSRDSLEEKHGRDNLIRGTYYGIMLVMCLYHLLLWCMIREGAHLYYVGFALSISSFQLVNEGVAFTLLWPDHPAWSNHGYFFSVLATQFFVLSFARSTLDIPKTTPELASVFRVLIWSGFALMMLSPVLPVQLKFQIIAFLALIISLFLLFAGALSLARGYLPARFFLLAWVFFLAAVCLFVFRLMGWTSSVYFYSKIMMVGSVICTVLLPLVLGDRVNLLEQRRQEAHRAKQESEERFNLFMDNLPGWALIKDATLKIVFENKAHRDLFGTQLNKSIWDYAPCEMAQTITRKERQTMEQGEALSTVESYPTPQGMMRSFLFHRFPILSKNGAPLLGIIVFEITELEEAREKLQKAHDFLEERIARRSTRLEQTNELLTLIINNLPHAIFWKDRNSVYLGCNKAFALVCGYSNPDDLVGKRDKDLPWPLKKTEAVIRLDQQIIAGGPPQCSQERLEYFDKPQDVMVYRVPFCSNEGHVLGVLGIYVDITELTELKQTVITQTQLLKEKNSELQAKNDEIQRFQKQLLVQQKMTFLGTLITGLSNEVRNPLNNVANLSQVSLGFYAELCDYLQTKGRGSDEILSELGQNLALIQKHAEQAALTIHRVAEFSQDKAVANEATDINDLVSEFINLSGKSGEGVTLHKNYASQVGELVVARPKIGKVIINLVRNAFEATAARTKKENGNYQPEIWVETRVAPGTVEIGVRDNGEGVPRELSEKIFCPLFTTRPPGSGNVGMGLTIGYDIVSEQHGGQLELRQGGGHTEFVIILPTQARLKAHSHGRNPQDQASHSHP